MFRSERAGVAVRQRLKLTVGPSSGFAANAERLISPDKWVPSWRGSLVKAAWQRRRWGKEPNDDTHSCFWAAEVSKLIHQPFGERHRPHRPKTVSSRPYPTHTWVGCWNSSCLTSSTGLCRASQETGNLNLFVWCSSICPSHTRPRRAWIGF